LARLTGGAFVLSDLKTGEQTRSYAVLKQGEFKKDGIVANFCPFCGEPIMLKEQGGDNARQEVLDIVSKREQPMEDK
jgi:hypothetical protein